MKPFFSNTLYFRKRAAPLSGSALGFTLVEVLISAILMTICISAVALAVRVGTQLQTSDNNRRQARTFLRSTFEEEYGFLQYQMIPGSLTSDTAVDIDPREGNVLRGNLTTIITSDSVNTSNGTKMPSKSITLILTWTEMGATSDTVCQLISMNKKLTEIR